MNEITSLTNDKIKDLVKLHQRKYRNDSKYFLVEGKKSFEDIIDSKIEIQDIFILNTDYEKLNIKSDKITLCSEPVMKKLSTTDSTANIITVAIKQKTDIELIKHSKTIALFEDIKDPGNLGTIIRSAAAFNIGAIILYGSTIDLYNPKVLRSSAGNFFKVPIILISNLSELKKEFKDFNFISTALSEKNNINISDAKFDQKNIVMFGSEADGLSDSLTSLTNQNIIIDMNKNVESLNLSVAASIVFYEVFKSLN